MKDYSRRISLYCPVCGNSQFTMNDAEYDDLSDAPDEIRLQCLDCKGVFTKRELIEENQATINANIEDVKKEIIEDVEKELAKAMKKWR